MKRTPDGKWMGRHEALYHWLPVMLRWSYGQPLERMLERAAYYCSLQTARELRNCGDFIANNPDERKLWLRPCEFAQQWAARREILFEAIEKLKAIK